MLNIFRKEAIQSKHLDWIGKHSLTLARPPLPPSVVSLTTLGMIVALIIFGSYEINVEASGLVSFRPGIYTLTSPIDGLVTIAKKIEGEKVSMGEYLFTITNNIIHDGKEKHAKKVTIIRGKIANFEATKKNIMTYIDHVKDNYLQQYLLKQEQLINYQQLLITGNKKIDLAEYRLNLFTKNSKEGAISKMELNQATRQVFDAKEEAQRIKISISQINYEIKSLQIYFSKEMEAFKMKYDEYNQQLSDAHQILSEINSAASADLNAPLRGKLGYSYVIAGDAVKKGDVLAVVLPEGAQPMIILNLPSTAIGEIYTGQSLKIRVSSFPWRRYGKLNGIVKTVSPTATHTPNGMYFSVTAEPEHNPTFCLRHGMEVTANITTEKKSIFQWIFNFIAVKWKN